MIPRSQRVELAPASNQKPTRASFTRFSGGALLMTQPLPSAAQHVHDFLRRKGSLAQVQLLSETAATAQDAAKALDVSVSQIGKSIVFGRDNIVIVVVVCGDQRVDGEALSRLFQSKTKTLRADEVKSRTGYVIGGVSPFGLPANVRVVVDTRLQKYSLCYVAAGHPKAVVRTSGEELVALTGAAVETIALGS
jgi:prolyl-tRNA editing enzyme YbaK/EbsC (Cys-tRNA(Pro) deacylase)